MIVLSEIRAGYTLDGRRQAVWVGGQNLPVEDAEALRDRIDEAIREARTWPVPTPDGVTT